MEDTLEKWLESVLKHYDKVVFLYRISEELYIELRKTLKKEKRKFLLLTDMDNLEFPCSQRRLCENECKWLLELYSSYRFADHFIFLTDQVKFPWPTIVNFTEVGLCPIREILEAILK